MKRKGVHNFIKDYVIKTSKDINGVVNSAKATK